MNQKPSLEEDSFIEQDMQPTLMDAEQVETRAMLPANEILNRTNFYTLLQQFVENTDRPYLNLLLSHRVYRDLRIFDFDALQRAIKISYSRRSFEVKGYHRANMLWRYSRGGEISSDWTQLPCSQQRPAFWWYLIGLVGLIILVAVSFFMFLIQSNFIFLLFFMALIGIIYGVSGCVVFNRYPTNQWNTAVLDTYDLVDYMDGI